MAMAMTETQLKDIIKSGKSNLYLFYGAEGYLVEQYARLVAKYTVEEGFDAFNLQRFDGKDATIEQLEAAATALREGSIDAVVTAPGCKEGLHSVGYHFPGQTEFFADRLGVSNFAMCLTGQRLTVALGTIHTALADVPRLLTTAELVRIGTLLADFVCRSGKQNPRIALAGLNPHNGENGAFGDEEQRIISPAVQQLQAARPQAQFTGPCVPDCVYRDAALGAFDAILAPYHDQALIPLKLLDFDNAVNVTLGLPRFRTSPDHGTAFGIAGKGIANPASTIRAFRLALACARA